MYYMYDWIELVTFFPSFESQAHIQQDLCAIEYHVCLCDFTQQFSVSQSPFNPLNLINSIHFIFALFLQLISTKTTQKPAFSIEYISLKLLFKKNQFRFKWKNPVLLNSFLLRNLVVVGGLFKLEEIMHIFILFSPRITFHFYYFAFYNL